MGKTVAFVAGLTAKSDESLVRRFGGPIYVPIIALHPRCRVSRAGEPQCLIWPLAKRLAKLRRIISIMTYVVTEACIRCKYMDCVEVCPVDCFYEGENMLVIHPDECIDCGVCEPECPVEAIIPDSEPPAERWLELNREYAAVWPNITRKKPYPADADLWKDVPDKYAKYFTPNPGEAS